MTTMHDKTEAGSVRASVATRRTCSKHGQSACLDLMLHSVNTSYRHVSSWPDERVGRRVVVFVLSRSWEALIGLTLETADAAPF